MKWLITGGSGFIGSNLVRFLTRVRPEVNLVNLDALTYAGNPDNLKDLEPTPRYQFVRGSICDPAVVAETVAGVDAVIHVAAESHVDRSINDALVFINTNVIGTQVLLDAARRAGVPRFLYVSTDEVYGSLGPHGTFTENSPLAPNSPYAASKAGADLLARAAYHTHRMPVITTRCSNNYGPYQFPEKFIPLAIGNALRNAPIPVYGDGTNVRNWIHVEDHCRGILAALERGEPGEVYNLSSDIEVDNLTLVRRLLQLLGRNDSLIRFVTDRPGHDFRYSLSSERAKKELGWNAEIGFTDGLQRTVDWYLANQEWRARIENGQYRDYYEKQYGIRI